MKDKYKVIPMKSWGNLPIELQTQWSSKRCDIAFTVARIGSKSISSCVNDIRHKTINSSSLPIIAIMAATTTRRVTNPSPQNMAIFQFLLPSLVRTLDCGYQYQYVLGFDINDPFYDSIQGMDITTKWFQQYVQLPLEKNHIFIELFPIRVKNTLKKPGPVFNEMARAAYAKG